MSSRSKKKRLWREEKERKYQVEKGFYDTVIGNIEQMKKNYEEDKYIIGIDLAKSEDQTVYVNPENYKVNGL
jgi:hypothetical protein